MGKLGFLDIAPRTKTVVVGGIDVVIGAISLGDLASLALRFKPFRDLLAGGGFDRVEIVQLGRPVVAALIASGLGQLGNEEVEAKASSLAAGEQGELLFALYENSFPESVRGPFVQRLKLLFNTSLAAAESTRDLPSESSPAT